MTQSSTKRPGIVRFVADERGTATIELVVWIPFFLLMLLLIVDASVFYWRYTAMWDATRDIARMISVGRYGVVGDATLAAVSAEINADVQARLGSQFTVTLLDIAGFDPALRVSANVGALSIFDFYGAFASESPTIVTQVRLHKEPF